MKKHEAIEVLEDLRAHYEHLARQWGVANDGSLSFEEAARHPLRISLGS
jgi:hypothetical protein